jgi:hypothetical protein
MQDQQAEVQPLSTDELRALGDLLARGAPGSVETVSGTEASGFTHTVSDLRSGETTVYYEAPCVAMTTRRPASSTANTNVARRARARGAGRPAARRSRSTSSSSASSGDDGPSSDDGPAAPPASARLTLAPRASSAREQHLAKLSQLLGVPVERVEMHRWANQHGDLDASLTVYFTDGAKIRGHIGRWIGPRAVNWVRKSIMVACSTRSRFGTVQYDAEVLRTIIAVLDVWDDETVAERAPWAVAA